MLLNIAGERSALSKFLDLKAGHSPKDTTVQDINFYRDCNLQEAFSEQEVWWNEDIIEEIQTYCVPMSKALTQWKEVLTLHAILGSAADLSNEDLSFEWSKNNQAELDYDCQVTSQHLNIECVPLTLTMPVP